MKLVSRDPALILRLLAVSAFVGSLFVIGFALSPTVWMAVGFSALLTFSFAILGPGLVAALSLAIPPRARATGFSMDPSGLCLVFLLYLSSGGSVINGEFESE